MSAAINIHDAKTHLSRLIERALAGEEIVISKAGKPQVKLVKIVDPPKVKRKPGGWPGTGDIPDSVWFDPLPDDMLAAMESDDLLK